MKPFQDRKQYLLGTGDIVPNNNMAKGYSFQGEGARI